MNQVKEFPRPSLRLAVPVGRVIETPAIVEQSHMTNTSRSCIGDENKRYIEKHQSFCHTVTLLISYIARENIRRGHVVRLKLPMKYATTLGSLLAFDGHY
jgi:hypothetical protein